MKLAPTADSVLSVRGRVTTRLSMLWTFALMVAFALASGYHLGNFFPISSDEVEIMSASYKLATEGRYASDLLAGFAQADEHFFMNLPVINLLQAATFKVFGAGLWQARLPSVASGVALIAMVGWLAYRWGGLLVSVVATLLLVFWRTNLIGSEPRPPLLALAQSARYDLAVVAIVWMAIVFLNRVVERPSRRLGIAVGACAGVATLTQFYGIGVVLVIAAAYGRRWGRRVLTHSIPHATGGAFLAVLLPYLAYVGMYWAAFTAQASLQGDRVNFLSPTFYVANLVAEPNRYLSITDAVFASDAGLTTIPLGAWVLILCAMPAIVLLVAGRRENERTGQELLWMSSAASLVTLAFLERTKAVIYASFLLPALCIVMAMALARVSRWCRTARQPRVLRAAVGGTLICLLGVIVTDGMLGYRYNYREAQRVSPYLEVGMRIDTAVEPTATLLGSWRWWWALHEHPYRAVPSLLQAWVNAAEDDQPTTIRQLVATSGADYVILDRDARADLDRAPQELQDAVVVFLRRCTTLLRAWDDPTYGRVEIRRIACANA